MSDLERTITAFLIDRRAQGLSPTTIKTYTHELISLQRYLTDSIDCKDDITPHTIREYLLHLQVEKGRNPGGCHIAYRVIKTWLFCWELEIDDYTAPIRKVKRHTLTMDPWNLSTWMIDPNLLDDNREDLKPKDSNLELAQRRYSPGDRLLTDSR